ncbi:Oidioi.mRNA.OKI2018_I69.XSR.g16356.t1.cds [Oikopleura dioica]|uniref:Oidioi.mRNA.OKI2018_I69.XSR.g16356.t1.cds n=1 Tax=Oikopleura dioica TaxID=34765 RepID=A0ABN7SN58_OIKDI|nr:Oidioi.mRNA.OKI2018_I69.XSR.g16356.t1.cds [Oikopleura dioica]
MAVSTLAEALATFQLECSWTSAKIELNQNIAVFEDSITADKISDQSIFLYVNDNNNENCRFNSLSHEWTFNECAKNGKNKIIYDRNHEIFSSPKVLFEVECLTATSSKSVTVDNPFLHADQTPGFPPFDVGSISDNPDEELEDVPKLSSFTPLTVPLKFIYTNGGTEVPTVGNKLLVDDEVTVSLNLEGFPEGVGGALGKCGVSLAGRKTTIFNDGCATVEGVRANALNSFDFALPFCSDFSTKLIEISCTGSFCTSDFCEGELPLCPSVHNFISC